MVCLVIKNNKKCSRNIWEEMEINKFLTWKYFILYLDKSPRQIRYYYKKFMESNKVNGWK